MTLSGHRDDRPAWAARIRRERVIRGWSQAEAVRALRMHFPGDPVGDASLLHDWSRWEAGQDEPGSTAKAALASTFGTVTALLFGRPDDVDPASSATPASSLTQAPAGELNTSELLARMRAADAGPATLAALEARVDGLCSRYARAPAGQLLPLTRRWQTRLAELLERGLTLDQQRDLLRLAGYLTLLIGCLEWDLARLTDAESSRQLAASLGRQSGSADVSGWACELHAWFALTQGDFRTVIGTVEAGLAVAGGRPVAVQLTAQAAQAWARIGERRQVEVALDRTRRLLEVLGPPPNPASHFAIDPSRFDRWAMDCYRVLGEDRLAAGYAREVLRGSGIEGVESTVSGAERSPMRAAAAELTLGVVAARRGDLNAAIQHGKLALSGQRSCLPSLLMISRELLRVLEQDFSGRPEVSEYAHEVRLLQAEVLRR